MLTKDIIEKELQRSITTLNPNIDVEFGPVYDIFVKPIAEILEKVYDRIGYTEFVTDWSKMIEWSEEDLDKYMLNFGLKRSQGTYAVGVVTFYTNVKPVVDVKIPLGTVVETRNGIQFITVEEFFCAVNEVERFRNLVTGRYEFNVRVRSVDVGGDKNVPAGTIVRMVTAVPRIVGVVNKGAMIGGSGRESNKSFVEKLKMLVSGGLGIFSLENLKLKLLKDFESYMQDVSIVKEESIIDGIVDVFFKGVILKSVVETKVNYGFDLFLDKAPVIDVISVRAGMTEYVRGIDWEFLPDTGGYSGTTKGYGRISWMYGGAMPEIGTEVVVEYQYNGLVEEVEDWMLKSGIRFMFPFVVFRSAMEVKIEVGVKVRFFEGFLFRNYVQQVKNEIVQYVNGLKLGERLEVSDLVYILRKRIPGIDNVVVTKLCRKGESGVGDIVVKKFEYFSVGLEDIVVEEI